MFNLRSIARLALLAPVVLSAQACDDDSCDCENRIEFVEYTGTVEYAGMTTGKIRLNVYEPVGRRCAVDCGTEVTTFEPGFTYKELELTAAGPFTLDFAAQFARNLRPEIVVEAYYDRNDNGTCDAGEPTTSQTLTPGDHADIVVRLIDSVTCG